jgi:hypothetical protein
VRRIGFTQSRQARQVVESGGTAHGQQLLLLCGLCALA